MAPEPRPPQPIQPTFSLRLSGLPRVTEGKAIAAPAAAVEALRKLRRVESDSVLIIGNGAASLDVRLDGVKRRLQVERNGGLTCPPLSGKTAAPGEGSGRDGLPFPHLQPLLYWEKTMDNKIVYLIPAAGLLALFFTYMRAQWVARQDAGTDRMKRIAGYITDGAMAFLRAEYSKLVWFVIGVAVLLAVQ